MPETDTFYELCDKLGIMVWQDLMIANAETTRGFSQSILESQIAHNLYRIRNHASLILLCGGNEFNPYREDNAAAMFVQTRVCQDLAPHLLYHFTLDDSFTDKCFLVDAKLIKNGVKSANTTYWIKCTSALNDAETYAKYSSKRSGNLYFENGPWLRSDIMSAVKSDLRFDLLNAGNTGKYTYYDIIVENNSEIPAFPVTIH